MCIRDSPRDEAISKMKEMDEDYKVELIEDLPEDEVISFYKQGDFVDLCAGPHMEKTGQIKAVKLQSVAGAYWLSLIHIWKTTLKSLLRRLRKGTVKCGRCSMTPYGKKMKIRIKIWEP